MIITGGYVMTISLMKNAEERFKMPESMTRDQILELYYAFCDHCGPNYWFRENDTGRNIVNELGPKALEDWKRITGNS